MKFHCLSALLLSALPCPAVANIGTNDSNPKHLRNAEELEPEIVGGFVQMDVLPWFVRQFACDGSGTFTDCGSCGGALIHSDIVMTAAHCVDTHMLVPTEAFVGALTVDFSTSPTFHDGTELTMVAGSLQIHPNWDTNDIGSGYDIALYKISPVTNTVLSLNTDTAVPTNGQVVYAFGHGDTSDGGTSSTALKGLQTKAVVPCGPFDSGAPDQHVCIFADASSGVCQGDSGGPLVTSAVTTDPATAVDLGIASYVLGGCAMGSVDVYLDVSFFSDFISAYICDNSDSPPASCSATPVPTPMPSAATTPAPAPGTCFSKDATVHVLGQGPVAMKDLQIGDQVFSGHKGKTPLYETVYGFGHRNEESMADYLRITTSASQQPLEITGSHLIFVAGQKDPVRADSLQVGQELVQESLHHGASMTVRVTKIEPIISTGLYQPLTKDGTILVDGLKASTYVSVHELAPRVVALGLNVLSEQSGFHLWMAPYRFVCTKVAPQWCANDYSETEDGIAHWLAFGKRIVLVGERLPTWLLAIFVAVTVSFCGAAMFLDNLVEGDVMAVVTMFSALGMLWWSQRKIASKEKVA